MLCTHFLGEAGRLADRAAILDRGRLHAFGRPHELAAQLWPGLGVRIELEAPAAPDLLERVRALPRVLRAEATDAGAMVVVSERRDVAGVVGALVSWGVDVYAATPTPKTLEDVYFAYQETLGEDTAGLLEAMR